MSTSRAEVFFSLSVAKTGENLLRYIGKVTIQAKGLLTDRKILGNSQQENSTGNGTDSSERFIDQ